MDEWELAESLRRVREGSLDRRQFARTLLGLGLTAPMVVELLGPRPGHAQALRSVFTPTRRGGGGELKTLWWQAPTILNPHLATGAKDADASRIFYEGLVSFDPDGTIVPNLTAEIPTIENGGVARDGLSIMVKLKKGVQWHDGKPFTADDVVFTWEYVMDPATAATTSGAYRDIARIDKLDSHTVKIGYKNP
ncbi:MAG: peptide ABC transporter substrate-binding protein, partial [Candidatus Rokuibacteriota bacterium]